MELEYKLLKHNLLIFFFFPERHISIQRQLADLEKLAFVTEGNFDSTSSLNSDNLDAGISMFGFFFFSIISNNLSSLHS